MGILDRVKRIVKSKINRVRKKVFSDEDNEKIDENVDKIFEEYERRKKATKKFYEDTKNCVRRMTGIDKIEDAFKTLRMKPTKDFSVIRKRWIKLMKKFHPDKFQNKDEKKSAEKRAAEINEAYAILRDAYGDKK